MRSHGWIVYLQSKPYEELYEWVSSWVIHFIIWDLIELMDLRFSSQLDLLSAQFSNRLQSFRFTDKIFIVE